MLEARASLFGSMALIVIAALDLAAPADAQTGGDAHTAGSESSAKAGSAGAGTLEEVVVTAQRRSQNIQDVPITVNAATAADLSQFNIESAVDLNKITPGVVVQTVEGTVTAFMRGIGNNVTAVGNEQSTAVYVDGVYNVRLTPALLRLNDVDQIEVIEGPQGTLFGRNATAGLIQITTRTPTPGADPSGDIRVGYGSYNTADISAYLSSGLGPNVGVDLSVNYYNQMDGWGKNLYTGIATSRDDSYAVRNKWVFQPSDSTRVVAAVDYSYDNGSIGVGQQYDGPNASGGGYPNGSGPLPIVGMYNTNLNSPRFTETKSSGGSVRLDQDLDFAKFTDIAAYRRLTQTYSQDIDQSPLNSYDAIFPSYADQASEEIQLSSKDSSRIVWVAGLYYLYEKQAYTPATFSGTAFGYPAAQFEGFGQIKTNSYSGYAQATIPLVDRVRLTVGARYSLDDVHGQGGTDIHEFAVGEIPVQPFTSAEATFRKVTWKTVLDYKPTDDTLLYVSAGTGFKAGLFNLLTFNTVPAKSETLYTYEIGAKNQLFGNRLLLNGDFFFNHWLDPQVVNYSGGLSTLTNAGAARIYGAEIKADAVLTQQLSAHFSGTYLNGIYTNYPGAPSFVALTAPPYGLTAGPNIDATGNQTSRTPHFTGSAGPVYRVPVGPGGDQVSFAANYTYTGKYYWTPDNAIVSRAYGLVDANITYTFNNERTYVKAWGSNLTDAKYYYVVYEVSGVAGTSGAPGAPRTYGMTVGWKF